MIKYAIFKFKDGVIDCFLTNNDKGCVHISKAQLENAWWHDAKSYLKNADTLFSSPSHDEAVAFVLAEVERTNVQGLVEEYEDWTRILGLLIKEI
jgi:hypothetical protein